MNNFCKYCLEIDPPLIYPCHCTDGVHASCLNAWLRIRHISNESSCEICHGNYVGITQIENTESQVLFFMCYSCEWFEMGLYITGTIFGLSAGIVSVQPGYPYNNDAQFAFMLFVGFFLGLYSTGIAFTCQRYYELCNERRAIYNV
jgi:hypothetical protein